jgi:DNA-binding NarL/FixJ family response regulator
MWSRSSVTTRASPTGSPAAPAPVQPSAQPLSGTHSPFIGRVPESEAVLLAVRNPNSAGVVVVGAPGSGKTSLLHHVQRSLGDSHVVRVRGLASAASFPYRALSFLLSEVPADRMHPALLVNAVGKYLRDEADGRRIVLAVDNAEHLDESSATLIGQLIAGRVASVILTVTDFARADASFMALWRTSALRRVELPPFSEEETRLFVESRLGGPASREVVDAARAVGGGNPQATRGVLLAYTQRGLITRRGTAHVLLPGRPGTGETVVSHFPQLQALTPGQRGVVNLLALAGPLSWADLAQDTEPDDVDALQDAGLLVIDTQSEPRASLATEGLSAAVVDAVSAREADELLTRIEKAPSARRRLQDDPARLVPWMLKAGRPVTEESAVTAASVLNDDGEFERAAHLVDTVGADGSARLAYESLVASVGVGNARDSTVRAAELNRSADRLDVRSLILFRIEEARHRRLGTDTGADPSEPLAEAGSCLAEERRAALASNDPAQLADVTALDRLLVLARAELASFEGRYRDTLQLLDGIDVDAPHGDADVFELLVAAEALKLEANIVMNRQAAAEDLACSLAQHLALPAVSFRTADQALLRVGIAYLASGRTSEGSYDLGVFASSNRWSFRRGSLAALADALLLLAQDHVEEAADLLAPAVEQLRIADPHGVFALATSVLSYCNALSEPLEQGITHLPVSDGGRRGAWLVRRAAGHYRLLATARHGNRVEAARTLQDRAEGDLDRGADGWALVTLAAAVRSGRQEAVVGLRDLAAALEGPFARTLELYAQALVESDAGRLAEAMDSAAGLGDLRLVADIAQSGINATTRNEDRTSLRLIQRRLRELVPEPAPAEVTVGHLDLLTAREREVALLAAAGWSNRAIATHMFVSVRTVEGHLYQVYSKLEVSTRTALAQLLPAGSSS